jgi:hypothetical protein
VLSVTESHTDALDAMLADPEIRQSLAVIVANAPTLAALAAMGTGVLQRGPEIMDNINQSIIDLRSTEGDSALSQVGPALNSLAKLAPVTETLASRTETIQALLDSAILEPEIVNVIGGLGQAALEADQATRGKTASVGGIFALNRALKDPEVQHTLAYLIELAKAFGKNQRG